MRLALTVQLVQLAQLEACYAGDLMTQVASINALYIKSPMQRGIHYGKRLVLWMTGGEIGVTRGQCRSEGGGSDEAHKADA